MTEGEVEAMESLLPVDLILLGQCLLSLFLLFIVAVVVVFSYILSYFLFSFVRNYVQVDVLVGAHPWRPSGSQLGWEKRCDRSFQSWAEDPQWT